MLPLHVLLQPLPLPLPPPLPLPARLRNYMSKTTPEQTWK